MRRKKIIEILQIAAVGAALVALIVYPQASVAAAKDGLALCGNAIVPSLLPYFVLSSLIVETGATRKLGRALERVMRPLFNVNGECAAAFALGFVGGYPVGAKTVIALYENNRCTKTEAERLLSFCNNSGPAFIFGVVGAGVFASGRVGLLLYLAHTLASVLVGVLFRFYKRSPRDERRGAYRAAPPSVPFTRAFANSVRSAAVSTVNICGFVIFFTIFIKILFKSGAIPSIANLLGATLKPFGMTDTWAERLLTGFIELSSGVWTLKNAEGTLTASVAMAAFMLGWAGISVHTQVLSFVGESGLSVRTYIVGKALQGVLSAGIIFLLGRLIPFSVPASAIMADQVQRFAQMSFGRALLVSGIGAAGLFVVLLGTVWVVARRDMRRNGIV